MRPVSLRPAALGSALVLGMLCAPPVHAQPTTGPIPPPDATSPAKTKPKPKKGQKPATPSAPAVAAAPATAPAPAAASPAAPAARPPTSPAATSPATSAAAGEGVAFSATVAQATQAVPPPPPPPAPPAWGDPGSTSLSGTQLVPSQSETLLVPGQTTAAAQAPRGELEGRVATLETKLDAANALLKEYEGELKWLRMLKVTGYVQPQLVWEVFGATASPNATGGTLPPGVGANDVTTSPVGSSVPTTNQDLFRLRRARLKVEFMPVDFARFVFELDPTTPGGELGYGPSPMVREVEAEGIARWTSSIQTEFGAGIFRVPFGFENLQNDADRPFIEHSWGQRNMLPGEYDIGARAYTTFWNDRLTFQVAVVNGNMMGERTFTALPDLNHGKDLVGRLNANFGPVDAGVSGYYGQGQITDATLLAFKQYPRGAGNLEVALHHTFSETLGETRAYAEGTIATNMDRGVYYPAGIGLPAFPMNAAGQVVITEDVKSLHEWSAWIRAEQDFTRWFTLALRLDYYTPDDSVAKNGRTTYGAVAVVHFGRWLQYMLEYDHSIDNVRPVGAAAPTKLIDVVSNAAQVRF